MSEALVIFTPSGKRGHFPHGTPVLEAARRLGVDLDSVCGGRGICSRCQITPAFGAFPKHGVTVQPEALSPWNEVEARYKRLRGLVEGRRLGCQARIEGDVVVDVPPESQLHRQVIRKSAVERPIEMDPATRALYVEVTPPDMEAPSGDFERLCEALAREWGLPRPEIGLPLLADVQKTLRAGNWAVTAIVREGAEGAAPELLDLYPGFAETGLYGIAIDLGSTTIAGHLCDLRDGSVLAASGLMNPQIRFGEDLMSRVSYAMMNKGGADEMTAAVRAGLDTLCQALLIEAALPGRAVYEITLVGNPVMIHLLLGIDPTELGQAPFALARSTALTLPAAALGLSALSPAASAYILPAIAGHVGADCAAVALAEAPQKATDRVLIVDVGTNAELLLGVGGKVWACSSPTGPAFEGAQISAGQRAAPGAIERVAIDPVTKVARVKVIGCDLWSDAPGFREAVAQTGVTGICGSGIIEALAEMRLAGLLDASGLIGSPAQTGSPLVEAEGRTFSYLLYDARPLGGAALKVTQNDVRAIQLAKSALYAGARLLMEEAGLAEVDRVVLAGAFGAHISPAHALILGLIPDVPVAAVKAAGNAAGTGARMALCSRAARAEIETLVQKITKIETALAPGFQAHFVAANALPHAQDPFPQTRARYPLPEVLFGASSGEGRRRRRGGAAGPDGAAEA